MPMLKAITVIVICGATLSALSQSASQYTVATVAAVQSHQSNAGSSTSGASYDVSLKVGNATYVVLYTPPYGLQTVQYAVGRQFLVFVGEKTITFNDVLVTSTELPIESQTEAEPQSHRPIEAQSSSPPTVPTQLQTPIKSAEIVGLPGVKDKTQGTLTIEDGKLYFAHSGTKSQIATAAMEDVVTADDSQRVVRGTLGTLSMLGPYGSGRVLSMFRSKIDSLTIQYRDDNGGLHGVVFTMPTGTSEPFKQKLIAQGAHTTIPALGNTSVDSPHQVAAEGKQ
jgi:hypothetical protein